MWPIKTHVLLLVAALLLAVMVRSADAIQVQTIWLANAVTANTPLPLTVCNHKVLDNSCNAAHVEANTTATVQVTGTGTFTVTFKMSLDGTNYTPVECFDVTDRTKSVLGFTNVSGAARCNFLYYINFAAPITNCAGCTVTTVVTYGSAGVS